MKTVLIVEDDLINARVFAKILSKRGGVGGKTHGKCGRGNENCPIS